MAISEDFLSELLELSRNTVHNGSHEQIMQKITDLAGRYNNAVELAKNLQLAMESRASIEQAKGMIMLERRCTDDEAFQTLVAASQARNQKLRDIALEVIEGATNKDG